MDGALLGHTIWTFHWAGYKVYTHIIAAVRKGWQAQNESDMDAAAQEFGQAIGALGAAAFILWLTKWAASRRTASLGGEKKRDPVEEIADSRRENTSSDNGPLAPQPKLDSEETPAGHNGESTKTCTAEGDPISAASGHVFVNRTDFTLPGPIPLTWNTTWLSASTGMTESGHGWHHCFDQALRRKPDGSWLWRTEEGALVPFDAPRPEHPILNIEHQTQLHTDGQSVWMTRFDGLKYEFSSEMRGGRHFLSAVRNRNGQAIILSRSDRGHLQAITDSAGRILCVETDSSGRIQQISGPDPEKSGHSLVLASYCYDAEGNQTEFTNAIGGHWRYNYIGHLLTDLHYPDGNHYRFRYDSLARGAKARCVVAWGEGGLYKRLFLYDDAQSTTTVRDGNGATRVYHWNAQKRTVSMTDDTGRQTRWLRDESGLIVTGLIRSDGAVRRLMRDMFGRITVMCDFDGSQTTVCYAAPEADGTVLSQPLSVTEPAGRESRYEWDSSDNLTRFVDPGGRERRFLRDERGFPVALLDALGPVRRLGWSDAGEPVAEYTADGQCLVRRTFDSLGRLTVSQTGHDAPVLRAFNALGQVVSLSKNGNVHRFTFSPEGKMLCHSDPLGRKTQWEYEIFFKPVRRVQPDGSVLSYHYDGEMNLTRLTNAKGEHYALAYDGHDRLIGETGFDGRQRRYHYDSAGFLSAMEDEENRGATFRRDALGRLLETRRDDGTFEEFSYNPTGFLTGAVNEWGALAFAYDLSGLLLSEQAGDQTIRYEYDAAGRLVAACLPDGRRTESHWDERDSLSGVTFDGRTVASFHRDSLGREISRTAGSVTTLSEYDPQGRLLRQSGRGRSGDLLIERGYEWDAADQLSSLTDRLGGLTRYGYDVTGRLESVTGDIGAEYFAFDPAGNILGENDEAGRAVGDRLLFSGDRKFSYDRCGNRVREIRGAGGGVETLYRYRADNQLASVEERSRLGVKVTRFAYDALGRRTEKIFTAHSPVAANDATPSPMPEVRTCFLWSGNVLLAEGTAENPLTTVYLHEPGSFRPLALIRDGAVCHYHLDHLGTPRGVTNDDGRIVWQVRLKAWGGTARIVCEDIAQPIRFQGQYADTETGLLYNRFRYYTPNEGRYLQQDPIGLAGGINISAYVIAPTSWIDPFGLAGCCQEGVNNGEDYRYRGVSANHPMIEDARRGVVSPAIPGAHLTPEDHAEGGLSGQSQYVSWTSNKDLAEYHMNKDGPGGVLLRVPTGAPEPGDTWKWGWVHVNDWSEPEFLQEGTRTGIEVIIK